MNKNRNSFLDFPKYLNFYKDFIGRKIYIVFALATFASISESIGILMLMPIFSEITSSNSISSEPNSGFNISSLIDSIFELINIEKTIISTLILIVVFFALKGVITFIALAYNSFLRGKLLLIIKTTLFDNFSKMNYQYYVEKDSGHFGNLMNEQAARSIDAFRSLVLFVTQLINSLMYFLFALLVSINFGLMSLIIGFLLILVFKN